MPAAYNYSSSLFHHITVSGMLWVWGVGGKVLIKEAEGKQAVMSAEATINYWYTGGAHL